MPRSSRPKSHRSEKNGRDRSDSEDDRGSREKKLRAEEPASGGGSSSRISREAELEKRKPSSLIGTTEGDLSGEHGKKRKERAEDPVVSDRWDGGSEDDQAVDKKPIAKVFQPLDSDKAAKLKVLAIDLKGNGECSSRVELAKPPRLEKDSNRRDSTSSQCKDLKERDKDYSMDAKERDRDYSKDAKEGDIDYSKNAKDRDINCSKDEKERDKDCYKDAKERDRDYYKDAKEREGDYFSDLKVRDRDYSKDVRERDRDYFKDTKERDRDHSRDARERDRASYKDLRERDRNYSKNVSERDRERGSERDKRVQHASHERSDDPGSRKQTPKISSSEEEHAAKKNTEIAGGQILDDLHNPGSGKELDKHIRRDSSRDKDKCLGDIRDSDRRLSSRADRTKNSSYKEESHREKKYGDKYREDLERDQRHRDDKGRDERSSRDNNNSRSDSKHFRDENRPSEIRYKKSKIQDSDRDGSPYMDDHGTKPKDNRGRKRFADENDDHIDAKPRREDLEKNASYTSKLDLHTDRARRDYLHVEKVDSSLGSSRLKSSPSSSNHGGKDQSRPSSKRVVTCRKSLSEETLHPCTTSRGDHATAPLSLENIKPKEDVGSDALIEVAASHLDRTPMSDARTSPNTIVEKFSADRQFSDKTTARCSLDIEEGQNSSSSKDGRECWNTQDKEQALLLEKSISDDLSQSELPNGEPIPAGSSSFNRTSHLSGSSPSHPTPPPHVRRSPSVSGSFGDDNRVQVGDRKPNSRFKRSGEQSIGRGQGNTWKSSPTWPSPVANRFIPLQHGLPAPGYHTALQQFPAPYFGVRPSMDLNHTRVPYHVHETADRFSGHGRPFGWHNPVGDCPPHLQIWDGGNGVFGDETHIYGRPERDMNRHLMNSRGLEMSSHVWKGQNGNVNTELPIPQESEYSAHALSDEAWAEQTGQHSLKERASLVCLPADNSEFSNDKSPAKNAIETPRKSLHEKIPEPSTTSVPQKTKEQNDDNDVPFCCNYLSKLDISIGLVQPELYKQCMSLLGTRDLTSVYNDSKKGCPQNNQEDTRVAAKSTTHILSFLFPTGMKAVFQRSKSLYMKQNEGRKLKYTAAPSVSPEEKDSPEVSEADKMKSGNKQMTSADTSLAEEVMTADYQTSSDASLANADSTTNMGEERNTNTKGEGSPDDVMEQQSDSSSDAVHFVEVSQSCEALMVDCRVNLSRIHLSPGSTH